MVAGLSVRVTWVYLERAWKFERELSWSQPALYADILNAYEAEEQRRNVSLYLERFPHVATFTLDATFSQYTPQQAALLAALGSFVAKNHRKVLMAAVLGECNATCTALADEPDITHSEFNPAVHFGAVGGLAFNASNAVVRCHLGDDEQCAIAFASYNASAPPAGLNCVAGGSGVMDQKLLN